MKKLSFFLMAMLFSVMSFATEVTVTIGDYAAANGWENSVQQTSLTMDEVVTVTANPTTGTYNNTGKYYTSGTNWRMYQNEAPAIVVTAAEGYLLTSVTFTYESNKTGVMVDAAGAQVASGTAVALDNVASATFSVSNTNPDVSNGQARITVITVTYEAAVVEEPVEAKLYLTPNANWLKDNARFAAYFYGNGETWVSMTKVAGETNLYEVAVPTTKVYPNVIFCRMNPNAAANNWDNKWNQTEDLTIPTDGKNHYTVKENTWDKGGGTWSVWPLPVERTYVDVTITVTANAPASIKWANAGDKLADATDYVAMTAGENNTYTYTLAQVDEATGVDYTIKVGDFVSVAQNTSKNVTADFKDLMKQVVLKGIDDDWSDKNKMVIADDYLSASITLPLTAKDYEWKLTLGGDWFGGSKYTITRDKNSLVVADNGDGNGKLTADVEGDYVFTYTYATKTLTVTYPELEPEIAWIEIPLEISNLTTSEIPVADQTVLQLMGSNDMMDSEVMLFLNNYTGEEKAYEVNAESSFVTYGGMELTVMDGSITKSVDPELGDVYAGTVHASMDEDGQTMYVEFALTMYALPPIAIELEDVEIVVNEESAIAFFKATWEGSPLQVEVSGFEEVDFKEYPECWLSIGDDVAAAGPAAIIIEDGVAMLEGEFTSFATGKTYEVMLTGKLPVAEPVKHTVTITVNPEGAGTVTGAGEYEEGKEATLTATAAEGYEFTCWTSGEDTVSTENPYTFVVTADVALVANFEEAAPDYMLLEDNITNLVIDLENMAIMGGPSTMWQVEVFLGLAEDDNMDGQWSLSPESSVAIMGQDARFIDGYVYDIDVNAPAAKAVLYVEDSGFFYEIKLDMTSTPTEAIVVVVEDATVQIDTIPLFGDQVDYALKMTANWTYAEDGVTYPVLVEVPVYYLTATEPSEMTCTVTIGDADDYDPWLGFGEGTLTITTVEGVVTAKGIVVNPYTKVAFDVTVSGKLPQGPGTGLDNVQVEVKTVKMIKNGQLIINKGGREFNAQGATLK